MTLKLSCACVNDLTACLGTSLLKIQNGGLEYSSSIDPLRKQQDPWRHASLISTFICTQRRKETFEYVFINLKWTRWKKNAPTTVKSENEHDTSLVAALLSLWSKLRLWKQNSEKRSFWRGFHLQQNQPTNCVSFFLFGSESGGWIVFSIKELRTFSDASTCLIWSEETGYSTVQINALISTKRVFSCPYSNFNDCVSSTFLCDLESFKQCT